MIRTSIHPPLFIKKQTVSCSLFQPENSHGVTLRFEHDRQGSAWPHFEVTAYNLPEVDAELMSCVFNLTPENKRRVLDFTLGLRAMEEMSEDPENA